MKHAGHALLMLATTIGVDGRRSVARPETPDEQMNSGPRTQDSLLLQSSWSPQPDGNIGMPSCVALTTRQCSKTASEPAHCFATFFRSPRAYMQHRIIWWSKDAQAENSDARMIVVRLDATALHGHRS